MQTHFLTSKVEGLSLSGSTQERAVASRKLSQSGFSQVDCHPYSVQPFVTRVSSTTRGISVRASNGETPQQPSQLQIQHPVSRRATLAAGAAVFGLLIPFANEKALAEGQLFSPAKPIAQQIVSLLGNYQSDEDNVPRFFRVQSQLKPESIPNKVEMGTPSTSSSFSAAATSSPAPSNPPSLPTPTKGVDPVPPPPLAAKAVESLPEPGPAQAMAEPVQAMAEPAPPQTIEAMRSELLQSEVEVMDMPMGGTYEENDVSDKVARWGPVAASLGLAGWLLNPRTYSASTAASTNTNTPLTPAFAMAGAAGSMPESGSSSSGGHVDEEVEQMRQALEAQIAQNMSQLEAATEASQSAKTAESLLEDDVARRRQDILSVQGHLEGLEQLLTDTTTSLLVKEEEVSALSEQLESVLDEVKEKDHHADGLREKLSELSQALNEERVLKASVNKELESKSKEAAEFEARLAANSETLKKLELQLTEAVNESSQIPGLKAKLSSLIQDLNSQNERKMKVTRELAFSRQQLASKVGDANAMASQLAVSNKTLEELSEKLADVGKANAVIPSLQKDIESLRQALKKESDAKKKVGKELDWSRAALTAEKGNKDALSAQLSGTTVAVEQLTKQLAEAVEQANLLPAVKSKMASLLESMEKENASKNKVAKELAHTRRELIEKTGDAETYKAQYAAADQSAKLLSEKLASALEKAAVVPGLKNKVTSLLQSLNSEKAAKQKMSREMAWTRQSLIAKTAEADDLKARTARLEEELELAVKDAALVPGLQSKLQTLIEGLSKESQAKQRVAKELQHTRQSLIEKAGDAETLKLQLASATESVQSLEQQLDAALQEAGVLPVLKSKLGTLLQELTNETAAKLKVGKELSYTRGELGNKIGELSSASAEVSSLKAGTEKLLEQLSAAVAEAEVIPGMKVKITGLLETLVREKSTKANLTKELTWSRQALVSKASEADSFKNQLAASSRAVQELQDQLLVAAEEAKTVPGLKSKLSLLIKSLEKENSAKNRVGKELMYTRGELAAKIGEAATLKASNSQLQEQVVALMQESRVVAKDQGKIKELVEALSKETEAKKKVGLELAWARQSLVNNAGDIDSLKSQLNAKTESVQQLESQLKVAAADAAKVPGLWSKLEAFVQSVKGSGEKKKKVGKELDYARSQLADLTAEAASYKASSEALEEQLKVALAEANLLPAVKTKLAVLVEALKKEGDAKEKVAKELTFTRQSLIAKAEDAESFKLQLSYSNQAIQDLESQLAKTMQEAKLVPGLQKKMKSLVDALKRETEAKRKVGKELSYTRQELANKTGEASAWKAETGALQQQLLKVEREIAEKNAHVAQMQKQISILSQDITQKKGTKNSVYAELTSTTQALEGKIKEVKVLEAKLAASTRQVAVLEKQVVNLKQELDAKSAIYAKEKEIAFRAIATLEAKNVDLEEQKAVDTNLRTELQQKNLQLEKARSTAESARLDVVSQNKGLEKELAQEKNEVLKLRANVQKAVENATALQAEVNRLQAQLALGENADMTQLKKELATERSTSKALKEELVKVDKALAMAKEGVRTEMQKVAQLEAKLKLSRGETSVLRNQVLDLGRSLRSAEAKLDRIGGKRTRLGV